MAITGENALNILSTLLPQFNVDTVTVFTEEYAQVFRDARPIKAVIKESSKVMEHPIENGAVVTDHRIILPVEIQLSMILTPETYRQTYQQIKQYYLEGTLLVIQSRSGIYINQLIQEMPHEEDPTIYDTISLSLNLKQVQMVTAQYTTTPRTPKNTNTTDRGAQQTTQASEAQGSLTYRGLQRLAR